MPSNATSPPRISFLAFYLLWAERMGWEVPALHVRACAWLQDAYLGDEDRLLLMLPRGHNKSGILEIFNAWVLYCWGAVRILHQSESDGTALKTSRGTQSVLRHHPLTRGLLPEEMGTIEQWWIEGAQERDPRNASMYSKGILSNVTSSRADFIQNDDIEVPKNIATPEARDKLRFRLGEQVHIAVPGARELYVGTPHTHDSIYDEIRAGGANCMIVPMFEQSHRIERATLQRYELPFRPEYVFSGIGKGATLLREKVDYSLEGDVLVLVRPGGELIDCYAGAAWPERFTRDEMQKRRRKVKTTNEWDSQYQLKSKPVTQVRLDPARIIPYDAVPMIRSANGAESMWLGRQQIFGCAARWDPSSGKLRRDASALAVLLQDEAGRRYLQAVNALTGEIAEFGPDGKTITGGQVWQLCDVVEKYRLPRVSIETNGIGGFAPVVLRAALKQRGLTQCGVVEHTSTGNKNKRILGEFEPLLLSRGTLWAHVDVLRGDFWQQMRDWNPGVAEQADDLLDAAAGAIAETPERFKGKGGIPTGVPGQDWRPGAGTFEAKFARR